MTPWIRAWGRVAQFALAAGEAALSPSAYKSRARTVTLRQIYFTAWQVLPGFSLFSALFAAVVIQITVSVARDYNLAAYALELVFRTLVLEIIPLLTAFFVALRSGAAISTEIALLKVSGDLEEMHAAGLDPFEREFVPRVLAAAVSVVALTVLACALAMVVAYVVMYGVTPWGFADYTRTIALVFNPWALAGFTLKCFAFGVAVAAIPIAAGIDATRHIKSAPVAVMGGMVRLFFALGLIEIAALAIEHV